MALYSQKGAAGSDSRQYAKALSDSYQINP